MISSGSNKWLNVSFGPAIEFSITTKNHEEFVKQMVAIGQGTGRKYLPINDYTFGMSDEECEENDGKGCIFRNKHGNIVIYLREDISSIQLVLSQKDYLSHLHWKS